MKIKSTITKSRFDSFIYYIAFTLYVFRCTFFYNSMLGHMLGGEIMAFFIGLAVIILLVLKIVMTGHYKLSQMILAVAGAAAGLVVYITQGNTTPLMLFMFVIGAKGTKDITLGKIFAVCNGLIVGLSMLLCFAGIVEDRTFHAVDRGLRHSMGMTYVTIWAAYVFFITAAIIYIRYGKLHRFDWLILIGIAFIVDYYSKTRVEVAGLLLLAVLMIPPVLDRILHSKVFRFIAQTSFIWSLVLSYGLTFLYMLHPAKYKWLDNIFSTRLSLAGLGIVKYGFKPFGTSFRQQGWGSLNFDWNFGYFFIDSFYISYALMYGVIFMAVLAVIFTLAAFKLKDKDNWLLIFVFLSAIHGIIIPQMIDSYLCPFYIFLFARYTRQRTADRGEFPFVKQRIKARI